MAVSVCRLIWETKLHEERNENTPSGVFFYVKNSLQKLDIMACVFTINKDKKFRQTKGSGLTLF